MTSSPRMMILFAVIGVASLTILGSAWFSEFVLGMAPCGLCLRQRIGHYIIIPLSLAGVLANMRPSGGGRPASIILALGIVAGALFSLYWAGFHIGVEAKWWEGLATCGGGNTANMTIEELMNAPFAPCDQPTIIFGWFFGGLSMATVHAILLLPVTALAVFTLARAVQGRR